MFGILGHLAEAIIQGLMMVFGYVSNSSTFPHPLSEEEEAKYLTRLQHGDDEARAVLIERNLRLVAHIVKKFDNTGEETDDLISIGTVGLIKAIATFRPDKGTRLATYAARCIENDTWLARPGGRMWVCWLAPTYPLGGYSSKAQKWVPARAPCPVGWSSNKVQSEGGDRTWPRSVPTFHFHYSTNIENRSG